MIHHHKHCTTNVNAIAASFVLFATLLVICPFQFKIRTMNNAKFIWLKYTTTTAWLWKWMIDRFSWIPSRLIHIKLTFAHRLIFSVFWFSMDLFCVKYFDSKKWWWSGWNYANVYLCLELVRGHRSILPSKHLFKR